MDPNQRPDQEANLNKKDAPTAASEPGTTETKAQGKTAKAVLFDSNDIENLFESESDEENSKLATRPRTKSEANENKSATLTLQTSQF